MLALGELIHAPCCEPGGSRPVGRAVRLDGVRHRTGGGHGWREILFAVAPFTAFMAIYMNHVLP